MLDHPRVFEDPLSLRIIVGAGGSAHAATLEPGRVTRQQRLSPSFRAYMAVRSRYAEDELAGAVANGVRQYVVLGAGLDTFAYRNPHAAAGLRVFEVDHPATQAWKQEQLQATGIPVPAAMAFVSADFERETLAEALRRAPFQFGAPAFFSWLGVVPYLTNQALDETLSFIASLPPASGVVLDYAVPRTSLNAAECLALDALSARVARVGEPFRLFLDPAQLAARLHQTGFRHLEDMGRDAMNARYFSGRADRFRVKGNLAQLLSAAV